VAWSQRKGEKHTAANIEKENREGMKSKEEEEEVTEDRSGEKKSRTSGEAWHSTVHYLYTSRLPTYTAMDA
jgi:hypothetical protein